jgi:hypothetical protein
VEFIDQQQVMKLLGEQGVSLAPADGDLVQLQLEREDEVVQLHLSAGESTAVPRDGATLVRVPKERLPDVVEHIIGCLHLSQVLLFPMAKWRDVFDAVAFSLAANEEWQAVDAAATVELNTRDPLLCEPGDFHTLRALIEALLSDGETESQGLMLTTTAAPVGAELLPEGALRLSVGSQVLADELAEVFATT